MNATFVVWTEFARSQNEYAQRLSDGERFVIIHNSQPIAIVQPINADNVEVSIRDDSNE